MFFINFEINNMKKAFSVIELMRMSKSILSQILVAVVFLLAIETHAQCVPYQYFTGSSQAKMTNDGWVTSGGTWSYIQNSAISRSGSQHIAQSNRNTTIPAYIKSPKINAPKTFSFWAKSRYANSNCSLSFSDDNGATWTNINNGATTLSTNLNPTPYTVSSAVIPVLTSSWQLVTVTANFPASPYGYYFKINDARTNGTVATLCLDDFSWTSSDSTQNTIVVPEVNTDGLIPSNCAILVPTTAVYHFYDVGGPDDFYSNGQTNNVTFTPLDPAFKIKVSFVSSNYNLELVDKVIIYDNTTATGSQILGSPFFTPLVTPYVSSLSSDGSLTAQFLSNGPYVSTPVSSQSDGYEILIECSPPVCQLPTSTPTISNITSTTATINWTGISPGYEYAVTLTNTPPSASGDYTNSTTAVITGLVPNTFYYGWVRSKCSTTFYSDWVMSSGFKTECLAYTVPYIEDFNGLDYVLPNCTSATGGDWQTNLSTGNLLGSVSGNLFFTKPIALSSLTYYNLSYDYAALLGTADFEVYIGQVNNSSILYPVNKLFSHVGISTASSNSFIFNKATGVYYIGFYLVSTSNPSTTRLSIDNIVIDCPMPVITASSTLVCSPNSIITLSSSGTSVNKWATSAGVLYTNPIATWPYVANSNVKTVYLKTNTSATVTLTNVKGACNNSVTQYIEYKATTWNGTAWSNGVPDSTTQAIFNGNYTSTGDLYACSVIVTSGNVVFNSNHSLIVQNELKVTAGSLTFENNASLVQINDVTNAVGVYSGGNTGSITYKRTTNPMRRFDFTYWSAPVSPQTLAGLSPLTLYDKYMSYNATSNTWSILNSSSSMIPGKGYIIRGPQTFDMVFPQIFNGSFNGVPNNGTITTPIAGPNNLNLIGNPYPSALNADLFLSNPLNSAILDPTIYLWTHNTPVTGNNYSSSDYAVYNYLGGTGTTAAPSGVTGGFNNNVPNGKIASGQSFFIKGLASGNATFLNSMRVVGNNNQFFKMSQASNNVSDQNHRIWLDVKNEQDDYKQTLIGYSPNASNKLDRGYDAEIINSETAVSLYSIAENALLSIQGRSMPFNDSDEVDLGFSTKTLGRFTISLQNFEGLFLNQDIFLKDNKLNKVINLKKESYSFISDKGVFNDRFVLGYRNIFSALKNKEIASNDIIIFKPNQDLYIDSGNVIIQKIRVFDVRGRMLLEKEDISATQTTINVGSSNQVLLIEITTKDGIVITKKYVN